MKLLSLTSAVLLAAASPARSVDIRATQFPEKLPETIVLAGADYPAAAWLKPRVEEDPKMYAGKYGSRTMTDGTAELTLKMHLANSSSGDLRWHVDGTLVTTGGKDFRHVVSFQNAELREPAQPCFSIVRLILPGLFVWFTHPEDKEKKPQPAVVIGDQVYVKE